MTYRHLRGGFTVIELLVVLTIAAILVGLALPNFSRQVSNKRSVAQAEEFVSAIALARAEAIKRAGRVSVCASADGATCSGNWIDGYMIFFDYANRDDSTSPTLLNASGQSKILKYSGKQHSNSQITVVRNGGAASFFRFTSMGALARIDSFPVIITSKIQSCSAKSARQITIPISGMVRVESVDC